MQVPNVITRSNLRYINSTTKAVQDSNAVYEAMVNFIKISLILVCKITKPQDNIIYCIFS